MKTIKQLCFLVALCFLTGCSKEETNNLRGDLLAVQFQSAYIAHTIQTRTTDGGNQWEADDQIGIFMKEAGDPLFSAIESNRKYKTDAEGNFTSDGEGQALYWPQDGAAVDFIAYYPYQANLSTPYTYKVDVSDQRNPAAIDLLYSNNATGKSKSKEAVVLTFNHQLTKVTMTLTKGKGVSDADLNAMTVALTNMPTTADFSLANGTLSKKSNTVDITPEKVGQNYEAILIPKAAGANGKMTFKLRDETFSYTITDALEAGKQYNYTVTVTRKEVKVQTGEISDWKPTYAFYQIGDSYPDAENPIGIVFETSNGGRNGKIVSLYEPDKMLTWSTETVNTGATDALNGRKNMNAIAEYIAANDQKWSNFPAFERVHDKNEETTDYSDPDAKGIWYLPAMDELKSLYLVYNEDRGGFNTSLTAARGVKLSSASYWSSSENVNASAWYVNFNDGYRDYANKDYIQYSVRCVSAF